MGWTLATVLLGSRTNPGDPSSNIPFTPRAADEVLPEVRLDTSSLPAVVSSINAAAGRERVRLDPSGIALEEFEHRTENSPRQWREVRLGTALATGAGEALRTGVIDWREENGVIVMAAPGAVSCRVYDVSDLAADARAVFEQPQRPTPRGNICFGGGPPAPVDVLVKGVLEGLVRETIEPVAWEDPSRGWSVVAWGGHLLVRSSESGHRQVELLLGMLRRGGPVPSEPAGGDR